MNTNLSNMIEICHAISEVNSNVSHFAKHAFSFELDTKGLYITVDVALRNCTATVVLVISIIFACSKYCVTCIGKAKRNLVYLDKLCTLQDLQTVKRILSTYDSSSTSERL